MNRLLHVLCGAAGVLLVVMIAAPPAGLLPAEADSEALPVTATAQDEMIASLDPVQGIVQYQPATANPQDDGSWTILHGPVLVSAGDRIRTNRDGLAYLTFFEGVETQIGPNTLVVVSTLDLSDVANENFDISLDVLLGTTLTAIDVTLDADDRFEIHTPGATAVVRGTVWWTLVHQDGSAEFESVEGAFGIVPHVPVALPVMAAVAPAQDEGDAEAVAEEATDAALGAAADARARDPAVAAVWDTWIAFDPGVTSWFGPDGVKREDLEAIRLPDMQRALPPSDTCGDQVCQSFELSSCPIDCTAWLDLSACGNGVCEPDANEDLLLCAADCGPYAGAACGDGTCAADESGVTCPTDCAPDQYFSPVMGALCGNGTCDVTESSLTCAADCVSAVPAVSESETVVDPDATDPD